MPDTNSLHYPFQCDEFHSVVKDYKKGPLPEIVVLCGSTRFKDAWYNVGKRLTYQGKIVLSVGDFDTSRVNVQTDAETKAVLDELHKRKIDLADRVFVLNINGYIGESTRSEIDYANYYGKPITYLEPVDEN
jgi:hypothetical protein